MIYQAYTHKRSCIYFNHLRCLWWGQWELKASKYHNFWRFIKLAITASLCERPFFYFYVESPPSTFMHRLREHSCHFEFNVHCPKVIIDWFMIVVSLVLKLSVSSHPFKLEGVLCIYFAIPWRTSWKPFAMFFHIIWTHVWLWLFHCSWSFVCVSFHVITWLLSSYCQDYVFYAHLLSSLIPALNAYIDDQDCDGACHLKNYFFVITYLLEDEQELSLGMLDMSQTYL
jgi:hypothetical protein